MKKCFAIGLIMALVPGMCPAVYTRISDLTAEKLAKMKKLEKCQGTTKGLKIAGLSTLGLTAVGVAGNIAEAVVLNEYKDKVKKEQKEYQTQADLNKSLWAQRNAELAKTQSKQPEQKNPAASEKCNKIVQEFRQTIFDNTADHCFGEYKPSGISYQELLSFVEESRNKLKGQGYLVTDEYFPLTQRRELTWFDDGVEYRANFLFSDIKCSDGLFINREQNKCQKEKPADGETVKKDQEVIRPVVIHRFERDIVTQQGAMEKIRDYDKQMEDITLTYCDSPSKSSTSNDNYNDTLLCHGTDKDYIFRFGRIDEQAAIKLDKPSILKFDAPKVGEKLKLPSLTEEPDVIGDEIKDIQKCNDKCNALGMEVSTYHPNCECKNKVVEDVNDKKNRFFDSISKMTFDCKAAKSFLEDKEFPNNAKCTYAGNNAFNCNIASGEYAGNQAFIFQKITGSCNDVIADLSYTPVVNTKLSNNFKAPDVGFKTPSLNDETDVIGDEIKRIQEKEAKEQIKKDIEAAKPRNQVFNIHISGDRTMLGQAGIKGVYSEIQDYSNANDLLISPTECQRNGNTLTCSGPRNNKYVFNVDNIVNPGVLRQRAEAEKAQQHKMAEIKKDLSDLPFWLSKQRVANCDEAKSVAVDKMQSITGASANCSCTLVGSNAKVNCSNSMGSVSADMPIKK